MNNYNQMPKGVYDRKPLEERILERTSKDEATGCWVYQGYIDKDGYGQVSDGYRTRHAHRCMYEIKHGAIPEGLLAGHLCDEKYPADCKLYRRCCNPDHIKPMTSAENSQRASTLNRLPMPPCAFKPGQTGGENNVKAKLTGAKVIEIRKKGATAAYGDWSVLAEEYGVQYQTLYKIMKGKLWNKPEFFPPQE